MKKVASVVARDLKIAIKDPMALWIVIAPIVLAVVIVLISPGVNDSSLHLAIQSNVDKAVTVRLQEYARVTVYDTLEEVEARVLRRDEVVGITATPDGIELVAQGNESENGLMQAKLLKSLYDMDALNIEDNDSRMSYLSYRQKIAPLKLSLSVALLLMTTIVASMIIALGLVDEKADNTIKAANVTPMKQTSYVLSKSIIGVLVLIISSVVSLLVLGMVQINWLQMLLMLISCGGVSIIVAFLIGLASTDFIEAASSIKVLMMPMIASVLVYELTAEKWHWTVMWSPFYWAYKGMEEIINHTSTWGSIALYTAIVLVICAVVFKLSTKNIRKSLA